MADAGVCFVNKIDGVDKYWYDTWIPGIMEMMVNKIENVRKYPQIGEAMEAYGRVRGPLTAGIFPVGMGLMRVIPIEKSIMGKPGEHRMRKFPNTLMKMTFSQFRIVPAAQQEKSWVKAVVT